MDGICMRSWRTSRSGDNRLNDFQVRESAWEFVQVQEVFQRKLVRTRKHSHGARGFLPPVSFARCTGCQPGDMVLDTDLISWEEDLFSWKSRSRGRRNDNCHARQPCQEGGNIWFWCEHGGSQEGGGIFQTWEASEGAAEIGVN